MSQRSYGSNGIPDDAVVRAIQQRNAMPQRRLQYGRQDLTGVAAAGDQWVSIGPGVVNSPSRGMQAGRVTSLAIDPTNPSTVYVAAAGGGVWKSTNRGVGWTPLTDNLPSLASGAVAVDPFTGEVWYGTGELNFCRDCYYGAGVYRSADGGANWSRVNQDSFLSSPTSLIAFDRRNAGTLYVGRSTALWKSSDNGQTWRAILQGVVTDFALNPADSNTVYAALGNAFGAPTNGVYRSTDGGQTWTRLGGGLPEQSTIGRVALDIDPNSPSTVYALIARSSDYLLNGLYRSTDGGNTWTILAGLPPEIAVEITFANGLYNLMVRVDPKNSSVIYAGSADLFKSTDGGASWTNLHISEGQHDVVFDPSDLQTFYLATNSGVWKSSDGGQSFANLNNTLGITQFQNVAVHPGNPGRAVGATQDIGTALYSGGFAWDQGRLGDSGTAFYDPSNPNRMYASGHYTDLFRSEDGGKTWQYISQAITTSDRALFYPPFVKDPNQHSVLYFATHRLWRSQDQGNRWTAITGDLTNGGSASISALAVAPSSSQALYAGTSDARVVVSSDGGRNWSLTAALPNRFISSIAVHPQNSQRAFVTLSGFGSGHVFRTDTRGGSWQDISGNLPDIPVNTILVDELAPDRVYVGTDIGVFVLGSDGSWTPLTQGMPNVIVLGLSQSSATGMLVAATHGRGAFALAPGSRAPHIDSLSNTASLNPGPVSPGMTVTLVGSNLAATAATAATASPLPLMLGGTALAVNGIMAPLLSASDAQLTFVVPYGTTGSLAEITVVSGTWQAIVRVPRVEASPGIFQTDGEASVFHANGTRVSDAAPARAGEELILHATGLGPVDQPVATGAISPSPAVRTVIQPLVRVGSAQANVLFSGLAPGLIATYQVTFSVPPGLSGKVPLLLEVGGAVSNTVQITAAQ